MDVRITLNTRDFNRLHQSFYQGQEIGETLRDLLEYHGQQMAARASSIARASSTRVAASIESKIESSDKGLAHTLTVGSTMEGYPPDDSVSSAAWATFAHRIHYGYPGKGRRRVKWNRKAGYTEPNPFLIPVFEQHEKMIYKEIRDGIIKDIIQGSR